ncbi:T9SS type A sorting domain-containing protein [Hymenobacter antarcticus]|uniref:Secretion system C-terminal sorting domain-containing protein n=1 Tax=Hymenobacter antarcticus TaxID=486270 RepID=A0ABP7QK68_9BACT
MKILRLAIAGLLLAPLTHFQAAAQVLDPTFASPTSIFAPAAVFTMGDQQADGKRLLSGTFTRVNGTASGRLVRLDAAGAVDVPFGQNVGLGSNVFRIKNLPNGQYLLGANGGSITVGTTSRVELLRLNANGTPDNGFDPGPGPDFTNDYGYVQNYDVQADGKVVVVGYFNTYSGATAAGVVRLNADGSVDTGFSAGSGILSTSNQYASAYTVAVQPNGKILVGGDFETFNGTPAPGIVRLNANGSIDATFAPLLLAGSQVEGLTLQPDGKVLVNGYLVNTATPGSGPGLVRLLTTGAIDNTFAVSSSQFPVGSISTTFSDAAVRLQADGKIVVAGYFSTGPANGLARLTSTGALDNSFQFNGNPNSNPSSISLDATGGVVVGNYFNTLRNQENNLLRLTSTGASDPTFAAKLQIPGNVVAMVRQADGKLVVGGNFTEMNGQPVHRLARLATNGTLETSYSAATGVLPAAVTCLALQPDGKVVAGMVQGVSRLGTTGAPDLGFAAPALATSNLTAVAVQPDGRILVAGGLNGVGGAGLARLTSTGATDFSFSRAVSSTGTGSPNGTDALLVQADGKIVVGGRFRPTGQPSAVVRVVRYETTGALDPTFNNLSTFTATNGTTAPSNRVYALAQQPDGKLLVGGNFDAVDGTLHYGVARLDAAGMADASFAPNALLTGNVFALAQQPNGRVLLGGSFTNSSATTGQINLGRMLANGQTDASFGNTAVPNTTVRSLLVQPDGAIVLAGTFTTVNFQPALGVARITAPNVLAVAAPAAVAGRTAAWPVPAHGLLHVRPDASAHPRSIELLDALGRPVLALPVGTAAELTLNIERLPAGVYLLRVAYENGSVTRRIAVQ